MGALLASRMALFSKWLVKWLPFLAHGGVQAWIPQMQQSSLGCLKWMQHL
jgi:hypothetical protein